MSLCAIDIVMSASSPEFGREFRRVCNRARWTLDPATEKQVRAKITVSPSELDTQCAERSDVEVFADLSSANSKIKAKLSELSQEAPGKEQAVSSHAPTESDIAREKAC